MQGSLERAKISQDGFDSTMDDNMPEFVAEGLGVLPSINCYLTKFFSRNDTMTTRYFGISG